MRRKLIADKSSYDKKYDYKYVCINCNNGMQELYKKFSNSVKPVQCEKCHLIADKYIEFESIIILVDAMLLSEQVFRHMLYNRDFKLHWKLSLVLLLLESFALWRKKRSDDETELSQYDMGEKGFYICCLQNIVDYALITFFLLICTLLLRSQLLLITGLQKFTPTLLKAITIANFSKFFLLPIMVWRENTTEVGAYIHHLLVLAHHLLSLIYVYAVVSRLSKLHAAVIVLPMYIAKEYLKNIFSIYIEKNL